MKKNSTVDSLEVAKFAQHATEWWAMDGAFKTLHAINPVRIDFIQKFTSLAGARVLDVGCGGGILCEGMAKLGALVTGLDVGDDAIASARSHALNRQLTIDYACQPIETYEAGLFDHITCMEMLEHVPHPEVVIQHCFRLLNTGGYLFLSTLNRTVRAYATAIVAAEYVLGLLPRQTHDFDKFIKPSELARMVRNAGFETIGLSGIAYNPITSMATLDDSVDVNYLLVCQKS